MSAVEAFTESVLHQPSRCDEVLRDLVVFRPGQDGIADELGAVVRGDHTRLAAVSDQSGQFGATERSAADRLGGGRVHFFAPIAGFVAVVSAALGSAPAPWYPTWPFWDRTPMALEQDDGRCAEAVEDSCGFRRSRLA